MELLYAYKTITGNYPVELELHGNFGDLDKDVLNRHVYEAVDNLLANTREERIKADPKVEARRLKTIRELKAIFGNYALYVEETKNEYSGTVKDWLIITTSEGRIKIGWRKRVIVLDWSDSDIKSLANELFPEEDVTKGSFYIHAWSEEKAKEYLDILMDVE